MRAKALLATRTPRPGGPAGDATICVRPAEPAAARSGDARFAVGAAAVLAAGGVHSTADVTVPLLGAALAAQIGAETLGWLIHGPTFGVRRSV
jgi:hypothetical protein